MIKTNTTLYEFSHGKKPHGYGRWAFEVDGRVVFNTGTFGDAKNRVIKMSKITSPSIKEIKVLP